MLFYKLGKYLEAAKAFGKYGDSYPDGKEINEVIHWLGMSFFALGEYREAIPVFNEELSRFPNTDFRRDALRFMGMSYIMIGDTARGTEMLKKLAEE